MWISLKDFGPVSTHLDLGNLLPIMEPLVTASVRLPHYHPYQPTQTVGVSFLPTRGRSNQILAARGSIDAFNLGRLDKICIRQNAYLSIEPWSLVKIFDLPESLPPILIPNLHCPKIGL